MNQGQRYPSRGITPTNRGAQGMQQNGMDPNMQGYGPPQGQQYQQNGQQFDPMAIMRRQFGGQGGGASNAASFNWSTADSQSRLSADQRAYLESASGNMYDDDDLLKQEVMFYVGKIMLDFNKSCRMSNTNGPYRWFVNAVQAFIHFRGPNVPPCPIRSKFIEFVKQVTNLKNDIALKASVVGGYNIAIRMVNQQQLRQADTENFFTVGVINILTMEMMNWFANTKDGGQAYAHLTPDIIGIIENLQKYKNDLSECFSYMDIEFPYENLDPVPKVKISEESRPFQYADGYSGMFRSMEFGFPAQQNSEPGWRAMDEMIQRNAANYQRQTQNPGYQPQQQQYDFGSPQIDFGLSDGKRRDYENITSDNLSAFDLDVFRNVPGTEWYVVEDSIWCRLVNVLKRKRSFGHVAVNFPDTVTLVGFTDFANKEGWYTNTLRVEGLNKATVLSDPSLLLPILEQNEKGFVDIKTTEASNYINLENKEDFVPLPIAKLKESPVVVTNDQVIESEQSKDIEETVNALFDELKPRTECFFGVSSAASNISKFRLMDEDEVRMVYRVLPFLVKENGHQAKNFFSLVETAEDALKNYIGNEELTERIADHITEQLNRWFIECRGFGATSSDNFNYNIKNLFDDLEGMREFFKKNDPATLDALLDGNKCRRLLDRCRLVASEETRKRILGKDDNALSAISNSRTLVLSRDMVFVKADNITAPIATYPEETVSVKRSVLPEIFALLSKAYGQSASQLSAGADLLISFTQDPSAVWLFMTTDFDENTATLRRMPRKQQLVDYTFQTFR